MSNDITEESRRKLVLLFDRVYPATRADLEAALGADNVWDTEQLRESFEVKGFMAPFAVVRRKSDGAIGTVMFQHSPRLYFAFVKDV
jgi:hypothetical protein